MPGWLRSRRREHPACAMTARVEVRRCGNDEIMFSPVGSAAIVVLVIGLLVAGSATAQVGTPTIPAVPTPSSTEAPTPAVLTVGRLPVQIMVSGDQVDAEGYVALARRSLETCGPIGSQPPAAVQQQYARALADFLARDDRVFDDVVEQGGSDRGAVHFEVGQDRGDRERMLDIRFARRTPLIAVRAGGKRIDALEPRRIEGGVVTLDVGRELLDRHETLFILQQHDDPERCTST